MDPFTQISESRIIFAKVSRIIEGIGLGLTGSANLGAAWIIDLKLLLVSEPNIGFDSPIIVFLM